MRYDQDDDHEDGGNGTRFAHRKPIKGQVGCNLFLDPDEMSILKAVKCAQESVNMSFQLVVRGELTKPIYTYT